MTNKLNATYSNFFMTLSSSLSMFSLRKGWDAADGMKQFSRTASMDVIGMDILALTEGLGKLVTKLYALELLLFEVGKAVSFESVDPDNIREAQDILFPIHIQR